MAHRLSEWAVGVLVMPCVGSTAAGLSDAMGPYLGQEPPGLAPLPFAERLFPFSRSSLSMSPDGSETYSADRAAGAIRLEVPMDAAPSQCLFEMEPH